MRIKILILSLILILTISICCYAIDESGSVVVDSDYFSCRAMDVYDYGMTYLFTKHTSSTSTGIYTKEIFDSSYIFNGIYNLYPIFYPNSSFSYVENFKYLTVSVDVAVVSPYVLIESNSLLFVSNDSSYIVDVGDDFYGVVINYNGIDRNAVNIHYIVDITSLPFDVEDIQIIVPIFSIRTSVSESLSFLFSDLKIEYYKNYQDVIVDVNSNVQEVISQNNVIINNLGQVNQKLDNILNAGPSQEEEESFNNELSKDNELHESYKNLENSYLNDVQSGLDVSIDYDISQFKDNLSGILGNSVITGFLGYLYSNPFVVVCFLVLPLFWLVYLVIFRG